MKIKGQSLSKFTVEWDQDNKSETILTAVNELNHYLSVYYPTSNSDYNPENFIYIGVSAIGDCRERLAELTGEDSFVIFTYKSDVIICGKTDLGTLYGTYHFIEKFLGVDWLTPNCETFDEPANVSEIDIKYQFKTFLRYCHSYNGCDEKFRVRRRLNYTVGDINDKPAYGGVRGIKYAFSWGLFGHTFEILLPYEQYYISHPEYFSFSPNHMGENHRYQICLTNPDVLKIVTENALKYLDAHPDCKIISISQNDSYFDFQDNYCVCDNCKNIMQQEGAYSGVLLQFVNQVAAKIAERYPDVKVHTFAYHFTEDAPQHIKPADNVIIQFCLHLPFGFALTDNEEVSRREKDKIDRWSNICKNIFIWTYLCDFSNYFASVGNFRALYYNTRYFYQKGVKGMFQQDSSDYSCYGFSELRSYLVAKLFTEPDMTYFEYKKLILKFLSGYYGQGGKYIYKYILFLDDKYDYIDFNCMTTEEYINFFADKDFIDDGNDLFDKAEKLAENEEIKNRIKKCRLQLDYLNLFYLYKTAVDDLSKKEYENRYKAFLSKMVDCGVKRYKEGGNIPDIERIDYSKIPLTLSQKDKIILLAENKETEWLYSDDNTLGNNNDFGFRFKLQANDDLLHIIVDVKDEEIICNDDNLASWEQDCVEIYISESFNRTSKLIKGDYSYRVNAHGFTYSINGKYKILSAKSVVSEKGYQIYFTVKLDKKISEYNNLGFELMAHDFSKKGYESTSYWNAMKFSAVCDHPYYYGIIKINKED